MYAWFESCSYSETPPQACLNHQLDAVVVCYEGEQPWCDAVHNDLSRDCVFLLPFSFKEPSDYSCYSYTLEAFARYPNGTYVYTKYPQLCVNGSYPTVCASDLDEADIKLLCVGDLFDHGYIVQPEDVQDKLYRPITSVGITNISCPDYSKYFEPFDCSYELSHDHCETSGGPSIISCSYQGRGRNNYWCGYNHICKTWCLLI